MKKLFFVLGFSFVLCVSSFVSAADLPAEAGLSLDDVIKNLQSNQSKIKDMYAETVTTVTSNMAMPGQESKGPQKMTQKAKMWTKGADKSKIEMLSPMKQITITNGDQMAIINPETGQKMIQDLKKMREKSGMPDSSKQIYSERSRGMSMEKAKEFFSLSVVKKDNSYVITGIPKKENKFMGKMEFYVDSDKWVPVKILMYDGKGKPMSQSEIQYQQISGVYVPVKNISNVTTPMGAMKVEMEFENIKVNQGIKDSEFKI